MSLTPMTTTSETLGGETLTKAPVQPSPSKDFYGREVKKIARDSLIAASCGLIATVCYFAYMQFTTVIAASSMVFFAGRTAYRAYNLHPKMGEASPSSSPRNAPLLEASLPFGPHRVDSPRVDQSVPPKLSSEALNTMMRPSPSTTPSNTVTQDS